MVDWVPLRHQLDVLRMDVQYVLRQAIKKTDDGKVYRSKAGDYLPFHIEHYGLLKQFDESFSADQPSLWQATAFGRRVVDNDHALREVAMDYMDLLSPEDLNVLQYHIMDWKFRDPAVVKFMQEIRDVDGGPTIGDFFPQAPWYFHTIGKQNVPRRLRDQEAERMYVDGGYTGIERSAWDLVHPQVDVA
jgi:hypothetical protein